MTETNATDHGILEAARTGDPSGLDLFYRAYSGKVRAILIRIVGSQVAEDLLQEVFLRALAGLPTFRGESSLKHWIGRIAVNCALKHRKREQLRRALPEHESPPAALPTPEEAALAEEDRRRARQALEALPAQDRQILVLREIIGLPYEVIRQTLELASEGTVKSRLHHARQAIRRLWSQRRTNPGRKP